MRERRLFRLFISLPTSHARSRSVTKRTFNDKSTGEGGDLNSTTILEPISLSFFLPLPPLSLYFSVFLLLSLYFSVFLLPVSVSLSLSLSLSRFARKTNDDVRLELSAALRGSKWARMLHINFSSPVISGDVDSYILAARFALRCGRVIPSSVCLTRRLCSII